MRVKTDQVLLSFGFRYERDNQKRPRKTICNVFQLTNPEDKTGKLIGEGEAICHTNDQLRKASGRKIALARALENSGMDRDLRTRVWTQYLGTSTI